MISDTLGRSVKLRVSANALKTVDHRGGLDAFLLHAKDDVLAPKMRDLKRAIAEEAGHGGLRTLRASTVAAVSWPGLCRPFRFLRLIPTA